MTWARAERRATPRHNLDSSGDDLRFRPYIRTEELVQDYAVGLEATEASAWLREVWEWSQATGERMSVLLIEDFRQSGIISEDEYVRSL